MATKIFHGRSSRYAVVGFSLLELMIVVAIIAILAAIANTSYRDYVIKSRRAAAATCLLERAHFMERFYTTKLTYAGAPNPPAQCGPELNGFYTIAFSGTPAAKTFVLTATPSAKQDDSKCGTLSLNAQGARAASGTASSTPAVCW